MVFPDGMGDLSHWRDLNSFMQDTELFNIDRVNNLVICYEENKESVLKRLHEQGRHVSEIPFLPQIANKSTISSPEVTMSPLADEEVKLEINNNTVFVLCLPNKCTAKCYIDAFVHFCKTVPIDLQEIDKVFSISTNIFAYGKNHNKDRVPVSVMRPYFNQRTQFFYCGEHDSNTMATDVISICMGLGKDAYGIKIKKKLNTPLEILIRKIRNPLFKKFVEQSVFDNLENVLFIPVYFKDNRMSEIFVKSILNSEIVKNKKVIFYLSGSTFQLDDPNIQFIDGRKTQAQELSYNPNSKAHVLFNFNFDDEDYSKILNMSSYLSPIGGCSGDVSLEEMVSLGMFPFYEFPPWKQGQFLTDYISAINTTMGDIFSKMLCLSEELTELLFEREDHWASIFSKLFTFENFKIWEDIYKQIVQEKNYYEQLLLFFAKEYPEMLTVETLSRTKNGVNEILEKEERDRILRVCNGLMEEYSTVTPINGPSIKAFISATQSIYNNTISLGQFSKELHNLLNNTELLHDSKFEKYALLIRSNLAIARLDSNLEKPLIEIISCLQKYLDGGTRKKIEPLNTQLQTFSIFNPAEEEKLASTSKAQLILRANYLLHGWNYDINTKQASPISNYDDSFEILKNILASAKQAFTQLTNNENLTILAKIDEIFNNLPFPSAKTGNELKI
jgi:hypothetical protein